MHPQFLVVGHAVQDLISEGDPGVWRLGGAAAYAAILARNLGLRTAILSAAAGDLPLAELLPGIECRIVPSRRTTRMRNVYAENGRRDQYVPQVANTLTAEHLPQEWSGASVVLLGPVLGEVDDALADRFPGEMLGIGAQGWLRRVGRDQRVRSLPPADWDARHILDRARVLFLSDEDISSDEAAPALAYWSDLVQTVAFTRGYGGADVCHRGEWRHIEAFPANAVDPTGAGDVFAAAFLIRLSESGDVWKATRFANCAASFAVEGAGVAAIPNRAQIEARLAEHPGIGAV